MPRKIFAREARSFWLESSSSHHFCPRVQPLRSISLIRVAAARCGTLPSSAAHLGIIVTGRMCLNVARKSLPLLAPDGSKLSRFLFVHKGEMSGGVGLYPIKLRWAAPYTESDSPSSPSVRKPESSNELVPSASRTRQRIWRGGPPPEEEEELPQPPVKVGKGLGPLAAHWITAQTPARVA